MSELKPDPDIGHHGRFVAKALKVELVTDKEHAELCRLQREWDNVRTAGDSLPSPKSVYEKQMSDYTSALARGQASALPSPKPLEMIQAELGEQQRAAAFARQGAAAAALPLCRLISQRFCAAVTALASDIEKADEQTYAQFGFPPGPCPLAASLRRLVAQQVPRVEPFAGFDFQPHYQLPFLDF
jgi:hypothetical protein